MYILSESTILHTIEKEIPDLQRCIVEKLGSRIRRIDRYIQLCILGAVNCAQQCNLPTSTSMIIATGNGTVSTVAKIMETVFIEHYPPKPLHFVNSLGNSACHFLSKILNLQGNSLVISKGNLSFEAALIHASAQFANKSSEKILLGGVDECPEPIEHHKARLGLGCEIKQFYEGSHWLVLSNEPTPEDALKIKISTPEYYESLKDLKVTPVFDPRNSALCVFFNFIPDNKDLEILELRAEQCCSPIEYSHPHPVYSGSNILLAVEKIRSKDFESALIISRDKYTQGFCMTQIRAEL